VIVAKAAGVPVTVTAGAGKVELTTPEGSLEGTVDTVRFLARLHAPLYGADALQATEVDAILAASASGSLCLTQLNDAIKSRQFFVGGQLTAADAVIFAELQGRLSATEHPNLARWSSTISAEAAVKDALKVVNTAAKKASSGSATGAVEHNKEQGKYIDLEGAEDGKVVVRFPPEASGYLHIGHAKAALLNDFYARRFHGARLFACECHKRV
jgi:hypothetical protein